ncbi:hypothetical protein ACLBWH_07895 [Sphingomonas sp. M6A6_1c]
MDFHPLIIGVSWFCDALVVESSPAQRPFGVKVTPFFHRLACGIRCGQIRLRWLVRDRRRRKEQT